MIVIIVSMFWIFAMWAVLNWTTKFDDSKEIGAGNTAYSIQRLSLATAQMIAMLSVIGNYNPDRRLASVGWLLLDGLWILVALILTRLVVDWVVLPKVNNTEALLNHNHAVAAVEAGAYLGFGFIAGAALTGTAGSNWRNFISAVVFYILGVAVTCVIFRIHDSLTKHQLDRELEAGNLLVGIKVGSLVFALANVISLGVAGDLATWGNGFAAFGLTTLFSVVILYASWFLLHAFGPGQRNRSDRRSNLAPTVVSAGLLVALSFLVKAVIATFL